MDPVYAGEGGGGVPGGPGFGGCLQGLMKVSGDLGFGFFLDGGNFQGDELAGLGVGCFA